jgi:fucose permease
MRLVERHHLVPFLALFTVFVLFGASMTVVGATLPKILADFHWSYLAAGVVIAAGAIAYFVATFVAGHFVQQRGARPTIVIGLVLAAVGLALFAATPDPVTNTLLAALIGFGQGGIEVGVNWTTLRIDRDGSGRAMSVIHGAFALGAIIGPLAVGLVLHADADWVAVFRGIAVVFALMSCLVLAVTLPERSSLPDENPGASVPPRLRRETAYWLGFFALFFYIGVELGVSNWIAEYFVADFGYTPAAGAILVSLFWTGLLAGRFGVPLVYHGEAGRAFVVLSVVATLAVAWLAGLAASAATSGVALIFACGLGCSIYYPAVITLLGRRFPRAQGQAIGFAASGGGIGAFLFPFVMSALAQDFGLRASFAACGISAVAMTVAALWLVRAARRAA